MIQSTEEAASRQAKEGWAQKTVAVGTQEGKLRHF